MGPTSQSKRLPVSCEPCRKRKIRCTRNRPPCDTCLRRGLGPADCIYLGQPRHSVGSDISNLAQEELFQRIRNLEDLLQKHVGSHALLDQQDGANGSTTPPPKSNSTTALSSSSPTNGSNHSLGSEAFSDGQHHRQADQQQQRDQMALVVQNVGSLSLSSSGHVRYEPRSAVLNSEVAQQTSKDYADELRSNSEDEDLSGFPFAWESPPSRSELLGRLPPGRYCDTLKDVYFRVFSPLFHILHDPTFEEEYSQFREDSNSASLSWLALLYVVLAIGVNALDDDHLLLPDIGRKSTPNANIKTLAARYRAGAMQCLAADGVMKRQSVRTLQTLVLLIYALNHASQPSWALVGMTHHIAISMGCHLDPEHFELDLLHAEERRRCWAGLVMLHMMQKISFRNLDEQRLSRRVRLPLDANDTDLVEGANIPQPPSGPTQMTYILFKFRLYDLALSICDQIFASNDPPQSTVVKLDREISAQQGEWNTRYHSDLQQETLPDAHIAHMNILFGYSHQLVLLLHRPNLNRYLSGETTDVTRGSRDKCLDSSRGMLLIQKHLAESPQFAPYKWYTAGLASFHAFHAAVVLATIAMRPDGGLELEEAAATLTDSVRVFQLLAARSALCEKAVPILRRLTEIVASSRSRSPPGIVPPATGGSNSSTAVATPTSSDLNLKSGFGSGSSPSYSPRQQQPPTKVSLHQFPQLQPQLQPPQSYPFVTTTPETTPGGDPGTTPLTCQASLQTPGGATDPSPMLPTTPMFTAEALQAQLQAQHWLGPGALTWANWDFLLPDPEAQQYQQQYQQYAYEYEMGGAGMQFEGPMPVLS